MFGFLALVGLHCGACSPAWAGNAVTLAWDTSADPSIAGYRVYQGTSPQAYTRWTDVGRASSFAISGLAAGGTYFFAVTAYDIRGLESPFSGEIHYTLPVGTNVSRPRLQARFTPAKQILLAGAGPIGYAYDVLASRDLRNWTNTGTLTVDASSLFQFVDPAPATNSPCFYRLSQTFPYPRGMSWTNLVASPVSVAIGKTATQSSTYHLGTHLANRAVDGITDGAWEGGSVASTESTPNAWWQVDLGSAHLIRAVTLWNRTDCCSERLANFYVLVSQNAFQSTNLQSTLSQPGVFGYYHYAPSAGPTSIGINQPGRYVRVQLAGTKFLSLAEVQVFETVTNVIRVP